MSAGRHIRLAYDPESASLIRASVRVRTAADLLDMDESQVRRLLADGAIEGHGHGVRGVRIFVDSISAYQEGRPLGGVIHKAPTEKKRSRSAAHGEAVAFLASLKLV